MADDFRRVNARSDLGSQADVKRWVPQIMPLLTSEDPLGVESFATHRLPWDDAPGAYETFQKKEDGMIKVVLRHQNYDKEHSCGGHCWEDSRYVTVRSRLV